jgi:hypothetical protein
VRGPPWRRNVTRHGSYQHYNIDFP